MIDGRFSRFFNLSLVLIALKKFLIDNQWSVWVAKSKFHLFIATGRACGRAMILQLRQPKLLTHYFCISNRRQHTHNTSHFSTLDFTTIRKRIAVARLIEGEPFPLRRIAAYSCESAKMAAQPKWTATKVRKEFLDFFAERQHTIGEFSCFFRGLFRYRGVLLHNIY